MISIQIKLPRVSPGRFALFLLSVTIFEESLPCIPVLR